MTFYNRCSLSSNYNVFVANHFKLCCKDGHTKLHFVSTMKLQIGAGDSSIPDFPVHYVHITIGVRSTALALEALALAASSQSEWVYEMFVDRSVIVRLAAWLLRQQNTTSGAFLRTAGIFDLRLLVSSRHSA